MLSTNIASYKGLCSWVIARGRGHTVSAAPATVTQLVVVIIIIIIMKSRKRFEAEN